MISRASLRIFAVLLVAMAAAPQALAGDSDRERRERSSETESRPAQRSDQDDAREALLQGKILPLATILAIVEKRVKGPVVEVELETEDKRFVYAVRVLSREGHMVDVELDARTGKILKVRKR